MTKGQDRGVNEEKTPAKTGRKLDEKQLQERFCRLYAERGDLPARTCAIQAGYSEASAAVTASRLLKRPAILERIEAIKQELGDNYIVRANKKRRELNYRYFFRKIYLQEYKRQLAELGWHERNCVENRNLPSLRWKFRKQGITDHKALHRNAVRVAQELCDKRFGPVNQRKPVFDKTTKTWTTRAPR